MPTASVMKLLADFRLHSINEAQFIFQMHSLIGLYRVILSQLGNLAPGAYTFLSPPYTLLHLQKASERHPFDASSRHGTQVVEPLASTPLFLARP